MSIRALHIVPPLNRGGTRTYLLSVLRRLSGSEVEFHFTSFPERPGELDDQFRALGARLIPFPLWSKWQIPAFIRAFDRVLQKGNYDIVHAHDPEFAGYMLAYARRAGVIARFLHVHAVSWPSWERALHGLFYRTFGRRITLGAVTRGVAVSEAAGEAVFGPGWQTNPRYTLIHCAVDVDLFEKEHDSRSVRSELGIGADSFVLGIVGHLLPHKNHRKVLQVAARCTKVNARTRLLLVGDGPLRAEMAKFARELGLAQAAVFAGSRPDVPRMLSAMDVFVFPPFQEGLGLALVEAQAAGLPCVISDTVPSEALVRKDLVTVLSLDASDEEWAQACLRMAARRKPGDRAGLEAVRNSDFNADVSAARLLDEYRRALAGPRDAD